MPGVVVNTAVRTGPVGGAVAPASTFFCVGVAERGPIDEARLVTSLAEFEALYGGYVAYGYLQPQIKTFFEEGGARAYVARTVGASSTTGTLTLEDTASEPTVKLDATSPGAWSADVEVSVTDGDTAGTVIVRLYYQNELLFSTGECTTPAAIVSAINGSAVASLYVTATNMMSETAAPGNLPDAIAATALSAGNDRHAQIVDADHAASLDLFLAEYGPGAVAIPGAASTTVYDALLAHTVANRRIALCAFDQGDSSAAAIATAADYGATSGSEGMAFYWPWITVPNDAGSGTLAISPEGFVAAKRSIAHNTVGPWQAGAGLLSRSGYTLGLAVPVSSTVGDALDAGRVNALRHIQGTVRVYGARSASSDETNWRYITFRDTLNYIVAQAEASLEDLVFSTIDGRKTVFGRMEARLVALLEPIRQAGGLYEAFNVDGNQVDPGYSVEVSDSLNPVATLATGTVTGRVGVRLSSVGDRLTVTVTKSNLTSTVV